eukprot:TRINITY_DN17089_c0_g1_i1.p1 TRINITY_DN17089_c0_g1~~TRINITY_DN17089_c0_g1_i1.p1  ORF type:complete len:211 (-),score=15.86 TRINITY_DN17089_c0_g1_i1:34-666(-)
MGAQDSRGKEIECENINHEMIRMDSNHSKPCDHRLYERFLEISTGFSSLSGLFLIISGVWQIILARNHEEEEADIHNLSNCQNLCLMIITSGIFLWLWTISGLIIYIRKSISLNITCGVSNLIVILLFYFIYFASPHHQDHHPEFISSFLFVFCISIVSFIIHSLFILTRFTRTNIDDEEKEAKSRVKSSLEKPSHVKQKLAFSSDIYHC